MCAVIASSGLGCGVDAEREVESPAACAGQTNTDGSCAASDSTKEEAATFASAPAQLDAAGCFTVAAGAGFVTVALPDAAVLTTAYFTATPSGPGIDAVVGLTAGVPRRFDDLATAVRFAPSGVVDARDGGAYRADEALAYPAGALDFRVIADVTRKTYSVFQGTWQDARELARQYAFRPAAPASHLDHLAIIVDGTAGSLQVCSPRAEVSTGVAYSREGRYAVVALGDGAAISDGATTQRLAASGARTAELARGGELAADAAGNVIVASVAGGALGIDKYDAAFAPLWHGAASVTDGATVRAVASEPGGGALVAAGGEILRFSATGALVSRRAAAGAVAFDGTDAVAATVDGKEVTITRTDADGVVQWTRSFTGDAGVSAIAVGPDHGVVFGGELFQAMSFGGSTLPFLRTDNGPLNGYVVKLSASGDHVFSQKTGYTLVGGIAVDASRILVSSTERTQFVYERLQTLAPTGAVQATTAGFVAGFGENGTGGRIALGATRAWWGIETSWPQFPRWPYLLALGL